MTAAALTDGRLGRVRKAKQRIDAKATKALIQTDDSNDSTVVF